MRSSFAPHRLFSVICLACSALAQPTAEVALRGVEVGAPVLGHFLDSRAGRLISIVGVSGAASLRVGEDGQGRSISFLPHRDAALTTGGDERRLVQVDLDAVGGAARPISGGLVAVDQLIVSASGSAFAAYSRRDSRLQILRLLNSGELSVVREVSTQTLVGEIALRAVNDVGSVVLVSEERGDAKSTLASIHDGVVRALGSYQNLAAVEFLPNLTDALIAEGTGGSARLTLVRDITGSARPLVLGDGSAGLPEPIAIAYSAPTDRALLLSRTGDVVAISLSGGPTERVRCDCQPTGFQRLRGPAVFLLASTPDRAVVLDAQGALTLSTAMANDLLNGGR